MNIRIAISMRITEKKYPSGNVEIRDCLAHDWYSFLNVALPDALFFFMPNIGSGITQTIRDLNITGILLTGGEDWGRFPLRDETEMALLHFASDNQLPVLGVCRGMQILNRFCGGHDEPTNEHCATRHALNPLHNHLGEVPPLVNSFHNNAILQRNMGKGLFPYALGLDKTVEACYAEHLPWFGMMWHPEREATPAKEDIAFFQNVFMPYGGKHI